MKTRLCSLGGALVLLFAGAARATPPIEPTTLYGNNPAAWHYAEVDGIRLYYEIYGTGAPLVVLHGNGGSIAAMRFQIDYFKSHREVIGIDSRGCGKSQMGAGRLTYRGMADDVAALLTQLHTPPADVIGWSDGGIVALELALHHPAVVRRIAISGANLSPDGLAPADVKGMKADLQHAEEELAKGDHSQDWSRTCQNLQLMVTQPHITPEQLSHLQTRVLVMAGEHDLIPVKHTRLIAASLPHAQLHVFAGADHGALQEVPAEFNAVVARFLAAP